MNTNFIRATKGYSSGKYYHESKVNDITSGCASYLCNRDHDISTGLNSIGYYADKDYPGIYIDNVLVHDTESYTSGDTIGTLLDLDNNTVSFYKNNKLIKTVDSHLIGEVYPAIASSISNLDVYTTFGHKEFDLPKEQWDELSSQGVIPYDEPSALWMGDKEYNNKAIYLNGTDSYISIPYNAKQRPTNAISGSMFVYVDTLLEDNNTLLEYNTLGGIHLYINSDKELVFGVMRGTDTIYSEVKYLIPDIYSHMYIGFSYDGQISRLFVNDTIVVEKDWLDIKTIKPGTNTILSIGKHPTENKNYFNGTIDEFSLFNIGMNEEDFILNSTRKISGYEDGCIGAYSFDYDTNGSIEDVSSSALNGILYNIEYVRAEVNLLESIYVDLIGRNINEVSIIKHNEIFDYINNHPDKIIVPEDRYEELYPLYTTNMKIDGVDNEYNIFKNIFNNEIDIHSISCGEYHATVLKSDGSLISWGYNNYNQVTNTPTDNDFIQVSCGTYHATALKSDGSLVSWGRNINNVVTNTPTSNDFIQVSCGYYHATALKKDGSLVSWGRDTNNEVTNTPKGNDFIQVSCGQYHATALKSDGSLVSWGRDTELQVSNTPTGNDFIQVSCGTFHATALKRDGSLVSWGRNINNVVTNTPRGNDFIQVSCGNYHATALKRDGSLVSWGRNNNNEVTNTPTGNDFIQVSCGHTHATALKRDGSLISWGYNNYNQVTNTPTGNDFISSNTDIILSPSPIIEKYDNYIRNHDVESSLLISDTSIVTLLYNGIITTLTEPSSHFIVDNNTSIIEYMGDTIFSVGKGKSYKLYSNINNRISDIGSYTIVDPPRILEYNNTIFKTIPPHNNLLESSNLEIEEDLYNLSIPTNDRGAIGELSFKGKSPHTIVQKQPNINVAIDEVASIDLSQKIYSSEQFPLYMTMKWTRFADSVKFKVLDKRTREIISNGEIVPHATGNIISIPLPEISNNMIIEFESRSSVYNITDIEVVYGPIYIDYSESNIEYMDTMESISCGYYHATALKSDGSLVSWGSNGGNIVSNTPTDNDFIQVSCGTYHATALKSDGSLVSWGSNSNNEVTNTPTGNDFIQVSCGQNHATALKSDGSLVSWGRDTNNEVTNTPKGNDFIQVSCGQYHATALKKDGSLVSWGRDTERQVSNTPKGNDFIQVSCGFFHATALKKDGSLISWGLDTNNQVTNTPTGNDFIQVSCGYYHATALKKDGSLVSWGGNTGGVVTNTPTGNDFIQVSCGVYHATALKSDGSLVSWGSNSNNVVSDTPTGNDFNIYSDMDIPINSIFDPILGTTVDSLDQLDGTFNYKPTYYSVINNVKYNNTKHIDKYLIKSNDLYIATGLNSVISSTQPVYYGLSESARVNQWNEGGNSIIEGKLFKDNLLLSTTDIDSLRNLTLSYNANIAPKMTDFTLDLSIIHDEHAVIRGNILDIEGENLEVTTTIVAPIKGTTTETMTVSHNYSYQKAFSLEDNLGVGSNTITITVKDPRGLSNTWSTTIVVENLNPILVIVYNDRYFSSLINDIESDRIKLKIENTTSKKILEETEYIDTPAYYKYTFKTGDTNFGVNNTILYTIEDELGGITTYSFTIKGVYRSLMFMDESGNYYTDDTGNLIKPLDFKIIRSGETTESKFVVSNDTSYDLKDLMLSPFYGDLPEGCLIEFSEDNINRPEWYERLIVPEVFKNNDTITVKMRVITPKNSVKMGASFGVDASGTIIVGRDGIEEDEVIELEKNGYRVE